MLITSEMPPLHSHNVVAGRDDVITLERFDNFEAVRSLRDEWDELAERVGGDIFNTFDWCATWWKHFGHKRELRLFVARQGGRLAAIWPLFRETLSWGLAKIRVIRVVGCDHGVTTCNVLTEPDFANEVARGVIGDLSKEKRWDLLHVGEIPGYAQNAPSLAKALGECPQIERVELDDDVYPQAVFDVPGDYEAYVAGLSLKERRNVRKDERELAKEGGVYCEPRNEHELTRAFDSLIELHSRQWELRGRYGHFADVPGIDVFHREFAERSLENHRLGMIEVKSGDKTIASEYGLRFHGRLHWIIGGRAPEVSSRVGFCGLMRNAIRDRLTTIDGLPGEYDYKRRLGAKRLSVKMIRAFPSVGGSRIGFAVFRGMTQLVSLFYHRLWFWHLAPWLVVRAPHVGRVFNRPGLWERFGRSRFLVVKHHKKTEATSEAE